MTEPASDVKGNLAERRVLVIVAATIAFAAFLLSLLGTIKYGVGLWGDSASYIAGGESIAAGRGYLSYTGEPIVLWPPLFSFLISVPGLAGIPVRVGAQILNAGAFAGAVFLVARLAGSNWKTLIIGGLALTVSESVLYLSRSALTEPLFILLILAYFTMASRYRAKPSPANLLWLTAMASLIPVTRYTGILIFPMILVTVILADIDCRKRRTLHAVSAFAGAVIPLFLVLQRNMTYSANPMGARYPAEHSWQEVLQDLLQSTGEFAAPSSWLGTTIVSFIGAVIIAGLIAGYGRTIAKRNLNPPGGIEPWLYIALYLGLLLYSGIRYAFDGINYRMMAPVLPTLIIVGIASIERFRPRTQTAVLLAVLALYIFPGAVRCTLLTARQMIDGAGGFASRQWRHDPYLVRYVDASEPEGPVYSNVPQAVYLFTGMYCRRSPRSSMYATDTYGTADLRTFNSTVLDNGSVTLVWFEEREIPNVSVWTSNLYTLEQLEAELSFLHWDKEKTLPDGSVYTISAAE